MLQTPSLLDPTYPATAEPLLMGEKTRFGGDERARSALSQAWRAQIALVGMASEPWKGVTGPAGAVIASLRRIGWAAPGPGTWRQKDGGMISLADTAPAAIKAMLARATEAALWAALADRHPELELLREGAWLHPAREAVLKGDQVRDGCSRSVMIGGQ